MRYLSTFLLCVCATLSLKATHYWGADMSYECIGSDSIRVYFTQYYDCRGSATQLNLPVTNPGQLPPAPLSLNFKGIGAGCTLPAPISSWQPLRYLDVTPMCPSLVQLNACNLIGNPNPGVVAITHYRDYYTGNATCTQYEITFQSCCRPNAITSGAASDAIFLGPMLLDLSHTCNSSPTMAFDQTYFLCQGQPSTYYLNAFDPDGDSLSYELVPCMSGDTTTVIYNMGAGFTFVSPVGPSWLMTLDSTLGKLTFEPNPAHPSPGSMEVGPVCIKITEYRNGVEIGAIYRDAMVNVINCQAGPIAKPLLDSVAFENALFDSAQMCFTGFVGDTASICLTFTDPDTLNGLSAVLVRNNILGMVTTQTGVNPMTFCLKWLVDSSLLDTTIDLNVVVKDDACPLPQELFLPLKIKAVGPWLSDTVVDPSCGNADGSIRLAVLGGVPPYTFQWSHGPTTPNVSNLPAGAYTFTMTDAVGQVYRRSYSLNSGDIVVQRHTVLPCRLSDGAVNLTISGGVPPYRVLWNTGDTTTALMGLGAGGYSFTILDSNDCQYHEAFYLLDSTSCLETLGGIVYVDANGNCVYDVGEYTVPNVFVDMQPGGARVTGIDGRYAFDINPTRRQVYTIALPPQRPYQDTCHGNPAYTYDVGNPQLSPTQLDIPIRFTTNRDVEVAFSGQGVLTNVQTLTQYLTVTNVSNNPVSGLLTLEYDTAIQLVNFYPSPATWDSLLGVATWNVDSLFPGQVNQIVIQSRNGSGNLLDQFSMFGSISPSPADDISANDTARLWMLVRNAYDPNIKLPYPVGDGPEGYIHPEALDHTYDILFQNTGNWPATYVTIRDTLSGLYEVQSIVPMGSSHPFSLSIEEDSILVFQFDHINLPDSMSDPIGSIGSVSYQIQHEYGIPIGAKLTNRAGIYFDFNPPIITPIALNTIADTTTTSTNNFATLPLKVYPNPAKDVLYIKGNEQAVSFRLINLAGVEVMQRILPEGPNQVTLPDIPRGIYLLEIRNHQGIYRQKLILD